MRRLQLLDHSSLYYTATVISDRGLKLCPMDLVHAAIIYNYTLKASILRVWITTADVTTSQTMPRPLSFSVVQDH